MVIQPSSVFGSRRRVYHPAGRINTRWNSHRSQWESRTTGRENVGIGSTAREARQALDSQLLFKPVVRTNGFRTFNVDSKHFGPHAGCGRDVIRIKG